MRMPDITIQVRTAERAILGAILLNPKSYFDVLEMVRAEHFTTEINRRIYATIGDLLAAGKTASLMLIVARIGDEYEEDGRDGLLTLNYLTALMRDAEKDEVLSPFDFVETVVDAWCHRALSQTQHWLQGELAKPGADAQALLSALQDRTEAIKLNAQSTPSYTLAQVVRDVVSQSMVAMETEAMPGFDTGLPSLDEIMGRIFPGDLGGIAAQQGGGKTVIALQLARRIQHFGPVGFHQLEMHRNRLGTRLLAGEAKIPLKSIIAGDYGFFDKEELTRAEQRLAEERIHIDDRPKLAIEAIWERANLWKHRYGIVALIVDHLRLITARLRVRDKFERMEHNTSELKNIAKTLDVAVIVLSQVTRRSQRSDDPQFQLSDLDGGGALEQDADWVLSGVRRDEWLSKRRPHYASADEEEESKEFQAWLKNYKAAKGKIELTMLKNRNGATSDMREFLFNGPRFRIEEIDSYAE